MKKLIIIILLASIVNSLDCKAKVTLSMIMKDEAGRKLRECLEEVCHYIDEAVVIDDGSTDGSPTMAAEIFKKAKIPYRIIQNSESKFHKEYTLRQQQWEETIKTNPEWILNIDADQIFEVKMREAIHYLTNQNEIDAWLFRLYDFWDETHYREDELWCAHLAWGWCSLVRYKPGFNYVWKETPQHCGHFPRNIFDLPYARSSMRLKHYGWANEADRVAKYHRYMLLDPGAKYGSATQYESILDPHPHLVEWVE